MAKADLVQALRALVHEGNAIYGCVHGVVGPAAERGKQAGEVVRKCVGDARLMRFARELADAVDFAAEELGRFEGGAFSPAQIGAREKLGKALDNAKAVLPAP
jgi:hypothetical protein